ncbi:hypothetical protein ACEPAI_7051 [Sanghuangporus weigelae]
MFAKSIFASAAVVAIGASGIMAKPVNFWPSAELARRTESSSVVSVPSFDNYLGLSQMSNFDDFFGGSNFDSSLNVQTIIEQREQVVCQTQEIEIVQQKLVILTEVMKRILLEQVCEVEVQTIVVQQASSIISSFSNEIGHLSSRSAGFDSNIAGLLGQIVNSDGSLSTSNLGFKGSEVGNNTVAVGGNNWDDSKSPDSVKKAQDMAKQAANSTKSAASNSTSSS